VLPLIEAAHFNYQFETIQFPRPNGRLGRGACSWWDLVVRDRRTSRFCRCRSTCRHTDEYRAALQGVRERGDLGRWLGLFLEAVRVQATDAVVRAERLISLREGYRARVRSVTRGAANDLVDLTFEQPVLNARVVERRLSITRPAALGALRLLAELGILAELGGGPRRQLRWRAPEILEIVTGGSD
jgi:Fic family protein